MGNSVPSPSPDRKSLTDLRSLKITALDQEVACIFGPASDRDRVGRRIAVIPVDSAEAAMAELEATRRTDQSGGLNPSGGCARRRDATRRWVVFAAAIAIAAPQSVRLIGEHEAYHVDPAKSRATIHVGKAGAFSFIAGHRHEVSGPIQSGTVDVDLDTPSRSHVQLVIASSELKVLAAGEPEGDAPKVQEAMESEKVLDVARHPKITYESTSVAVKSRSGNVLELSITGRLTIRDVTQAVTVPVRVELGDSRLSANGRFDVKQSAFGIKPIPGGGVVAVKDALAIDFSIVATK